MHIIHCGAHFPKHPQNGEGESGIIFHTWAHAIWMKAMPPAFASATEGFVVTRVQVTRTHMQKYPRLSLAIIWPIAMFLHLWLAFDVRGSVN